MKNLKINNLLLLIIFVFALTFTASAQADTGAAPPAASAETPAKKRPPVFRPTKDQISQAQKMLIEKKLYSGEASGKYDDATRTGIRTMQKEKGIPETGTLNRVTLEAFGIELTPAQKAIPVTEPKAAATKASSSTSSTTGGTKRPAPFRANATQIKAAQKVLADGKMYTGEETGKLDTATRDGLKKYQDTNGIKVTGTLNAATLEKMGIALTDAQKANVAAQAAYDAAKKN